MRLTRTCETAVAKGIGTVAENQVKHGTTLRQEDRDTANDTPGTRDPTGAGRGLRVARVSNG
jgi:hypothetical protein